MKKRICTSLITLLFALPLFLNAQKKIDIIQESATLSIGNQPTYQISIPDANLESVKKDWMKLIRQNTKSKIEETGSEMNITGTLIKEIYHEPFNIYSALIGTDSAAKLVAAFEIDSVFFSADEANKNIQNEKTGNAIKNFIREFAVNQYKIAVQVQVDKEEKNLSKLNKEFESLSKQVESDRKDIKGNEQSIKNSQDAIATYEKDNERKITEINAKKEAIADIKDSPEMQKTAKEELKNLEKEKKSVENSLEKEQKNIVKYQTNIDELDRAVENNLKLIEEKKIEITNQETVVKQVTNTLNGIK